MSEQLNHEAIQPEATVHMQGEAGFMSLRTGMIGGAAALVLAGVGGGAYMHFKDDGTQPIDDHHPVTVSQAKINCEKYMGGEDKTTNSDLYDNLSFLPRDGKIETEADVKGYISYLFSKDGPLVTNDASLATIMATVVDPAHSGTIAVGDRDYQAAFTQKLAVYRAAGGEKQKLDDCKQAAETLMQVAHFNPAWADKGAEVTRFGAVRNGAYAITGFDPEKFPVVGKTRGIELSLPDVHSNDLNDFGSVLIRVDGKHTGQLLVRGQTQTGAVGLNGENLQKTNPKDKSVEGGQVAAGGGNGTEMQTQTVDQNGDLVNTKVNSNGTITITRTNPKTGKTTQTVAPAGTPLPTTSEIPTTPGAPTPAAPATPETPGAPTATTPSRGPVVTTTLPSGTTVTTVHGGSPTTTVVTVTRPPQTTTTQPEATTVVTQPETSTTKPKGSAPVTTLPQSTTIPGGGTLN